jgi:hypothetical protein
VPVQSSLGRRIDLFSGIEGATVCSTPPFETGDERYQWLDRIQAMAKGVITGEVLDFEIYELP